MPKTARPEPVRPSEVGVSEREPEPMQIEAARLLANDAKPRLHTAGFDDEQIREWANAYIAQHGGGDVDGFVRWIAASEGLPIPPAGT